MRRRRAHARGVDGRRQDHRVIVRAACHEARESPKNAWAPGPAACGRATYGVEMTAVAASRPRLPAARCGATLHHQLIGDGAVLTVTQRGNNVPEVLRCGRGDE